MDALESISLSFIENVATIVAFVAMLLAVIYLVKLFKKDG